ncbi:MAG: roadblock/LC7 domain-containing protein [Myxococcota bacterium]
MANTRHDNITKLIKALATNTPDVEASAVIDNDGLMIASALGAGVDDEAVAAMSAALLGIAERIVRELGRGAFEMVMTRGSEGYVILMRCGKDAVLSVLTTSSAKIGLIFMDLRRTAGEVAKLLG